MKVWRNHSLFKNTQVPIKEALCPWRLLYKYSSLSICVEKAVILIYFSSCKGSFFRCTILTSRWLWKCLQWQFPLTKAARNTTTPTSCLAISLLLLVLTTLTIREQSVEGRIWFLGTVVVQPETLHSAFVSLIAEPSRHFFSLSLSFSVPTQTAFSLATQQNTTYESKTGNKQCTAEMIYAQRFHSL